MITEHIWVNHSIMKTGEGSMFHTPHKFQVFVAFKSFELFERFTVLFFCFKNEKRYKKCRWDSCTNENVYSDSTPLGGSIVCQLSINRSVYMYEEESRSLMEHITSPEDLPMKHWNAWPDYIAGTEIVTAVYVEKRRAATRLAQDSQAGTDTGVLVCRCTSTRGAGWSPARHRGAAGTRPWRRSSSKSGCPMGRLPRRSDAVWEPETSSCTSKGRK